jgi:hypothetical protein
MEWDKFRMAQTFLQKANVIRPEDAEDSKRRDEALALQDVYYDCYMSSFSREDLIRRLQAIVAGDIQMPEEDVDPFFYRDTYIEEARSILSSIEQGHFK